MKMNVVNSDSVFETLGNEQSESDFKSNIVSLLKGAHIDWIDGDNEQGSRNEITRTADIVNHTLKIAIELKMEDASERLELLPSCIRGASVRSLAPLGNTANRYSKYIKNSEKKFRNYPDYKTILLVRTKVAPLFFITNWVDEKCHLSVEIGALLLLNADERNTKCLLNKYADQNRALSVQDLKDIFGLDILY